MKLMRDLKGIAYVLTHFGEAVDAEGRYRGGRVVLLVRGLPGYLRWRYERERSKGLSRADAARSALRSARNVAKAVM